MTMAPAFPWPFWTQVRPERRTGANEATAPATPTADARPVRRACDPLPILDAIRGRRRRRAWFQVTPQA
jgi:hypothetical protein